EPRRVPHAGRRGDAEVPDDHLAAVAVALRTYTSRATAPAQLGKGPKVRSSSPAPRGGGREGVGPPPRIACAGRPRAIAPPLPDPPRPSPLRGEGAAHPGSSFHFKTSFMSLDHRGVTGLSVKG